MRPWNRNVFVMPHRGRPRPWVARRVVGWDFPEAGDGMPNPWQVRDLVRAELAGLAHGC